MSCPLCPAQPTGHVVLDGTLGGSGPLTGPNFNITSDLGQTKGNNLFHSFSQFDLVNGDVATFSGPANIQNILSRITGANASSIDGTIESKIVGANLFFLNPHGVVFGQHAQVDVKGSFVVTSASYVKLADGGRFDADNPANDLLTAAPVSAFGFLSSTPGNISVQQSLLAVPTGKSFSVIGGDITVDGATIQAPSGRINLVSVKSTGELALDVTDFTALPYTGAFGALGQITVQNAGVVDASGDGGGQVVIRGGRLVVDNAVVEASTLGSSDGKGIDIDVTGDLVVNGGAISASTSGPGKGGAINVTAGSLSLDGQGITSGILSDAITGSGNGGDVSVTTHSLEIVNGARISAATGGAGNGGNIELTADAIHLDAQGSYLLTGIAVSSEGGSGNAGTMVIRPGTLGILSLEIVNGAMISARTLGSGNGGSIDLTATSLLLDGQASSGFTGLEARTYGDGNGGNISITTGSLQMLNGSEISAETEGTGAGGNINIVADTASLQSSSAINAQTAGLAVGGNINLTATTSLVLDGKRPDGSAGYAEIAAGNPFGDGDAPAGTIVITAGSLDVLNGADISASTKAGSDGGSIVIDAGALTLQNQASIRCSSVSGQAGGITINVRQPLLVDDRSVLSVSAAHSNGGDINVTSGSDIRVIDSQITAQAAQQGGNITLTSPFVHLLDSELNASAGNNGGNIGIDADFLVLNHSAIAADAINDNGGNIAITAGSSILLEDHSELSASALNGNGGDITADAGTDVRLIDSEIRAVAAHDGGNITLRAPLLVYALNGTISASAGDNGGNITIDPVFLVLSQSSITADAINNNGGNITVLADFFFRSNSPITADSEFGNPGTVLIQAIELDLSGTLVSLPGTLLGAESQLRQWCGARLPGGISSFLVLGKGGVSIGPDGPLPSFGVGPLGGVAR